MKSSELHKNIKVRIIETFLSRLVSGMVFPYMTIYLANNFGTKTAGYLLLVNVLLGIVITFIGGYYSDQFGRKKIIVLAESVKLLAFATMALCNSPWFQSAGITFIMMMMNSICLGLSGPANQAMLIDVSNPEQRKFMYSITYWSHNVAIAIGGIAGGFLFKQYLFELLIGMSSVSVIVVILVVFFIDESYNTVKSNIKPIHHVVQLFSGYKTVFQDRLFILFAIASILVLSMESQLYNYVGIRLVHEFKQQTFFGWKINGFNMIGILRTENTVLVVIFALFATKLINLMKDKTVLILGCSIFSVGYGFISYSNNCGVLIMFMFFLTIGEVLRIPVEQSYLASIPPENARSTYMAVNAIKSNLAMSISSLTVIISSYSSSLIMALYITGIGLTGTFIYFVISNKLDSRKAEEKMIKQFG